MEIFNLFQGLGAKMFSGQDSVQVKNLRAQQEVSGKHRQCAGAGESSPRQDPYLTDLTDPPGAC